MFIQIILGVTLLCYFSILSAGAFSRTSSNVRSEQISSEIRGELEKHLSRISGQIHAEGGLRNFLVKNCKQSGHLNPMLSCNFDSLFGPLVTSVDPRSTVSQFHDGHIARELSLHDYRSTFLQPYPVTTIYLNDVGYLEISVTFQPSARSLEQLKSQNLKITKLISP